MVMPTRTEGPARLLLVDDHTVVRTGMRRILQGHADARDPRWQVTEAGTGAQALAYLRSEPYRLAVMDLSMPGISGLTLVQLVKAEFPAVAILVLSMHAEEEYALRALISGANGYVTKDSAAEELVAAVLRVSEGGTYVSRCLAERVARQLSRLMPEPRQAELSGCELDVMRQIVAGQRVAGLVAGRPA